MGMEKNNKKAIREILHPLFWHHDFHVLRHIRQTFQLFLKKYLKKKVIVADCQDQENPYKVLLRPYIRKYISLNPPVATSLDYLSRDNRPLSIKNSSVDLIVSIQIRNFAPQVKSYLDEYRRILKKKGLLFLAAHGLWPYNRTSNDYYRYTREGLLKELTEANFRILENISILGPFSSVFQFKLVLINEYLTKGGILGRLMMAIICVIANIYIIILDRIFPPNDSHDASVYFICAQKNI